jgi:hypothetical protein
MTLDFTDSAPPALGPINIARSTAVAACYVALKHVFPEVPANAGCLRPITFAISEDTFLGVSAPRPVAGYTETILRMIGVVFGALAQADPARATAAPFGTINALSLAGRRDNGARWVMFCFFGGGLGGSPASDGLAHGNNPISTATIPPLEILEASYPVMFTHWALRPDSAGPGTHRGGVGAVYGVEALASGGADVALLGERGRFAPFGVAGGGAAALNTFQWTDARPARTPRRWPPRSPACTSRRGAGCCCRPRAGAAGATRSTGRAEAIERDLARGAGLARGRRPRLRGARMTASALVGVDVGGTFTDLAWFDPATGAFRTAKAPSNRGDEASGSPRASPASARRPASPPSSTAPPSAPTPCWSARAPGSASSPRGLPRRAGDAPPRPSPHLGPVGRLRAGGRPRACGSRWPSARWPTARSGRRWTPPRSPPARGTCCDGGRGARHLLHQRLRQPRQRGAPPSRPPARCGRRPTSPAPPRSCPRSGSSSAPPPPRSTPTCSPWSPPTSRGSKARWRRGASPAPSTSCSRTAGSCPPPPPAPSRCAPRCPAPRRA